MTALRQASSRGLFTPQLWRPAWASMVNPEAASALAAPGPTVSETPAQSTETQAVAPDLNSPHSKPSRPLPSLHMASFLSTSFSAPHHRSVAHFHCTAYARAEAAEQRTPPSERVERIANDIVQLNLLEVADLSELLRTKLKITEMPMAAGMMGGGGAAAGPSGGAAAAAPEEAKEEKSVFDVKLEKFDAPNKIKIIKEVRGMTSLGLKEAKDLVEKAPVVIKAGVSKAEAEEIIKKLQAVGATSTME
eukprot:TRINITY_DN7027_c0_g1_i1.p2 TRINITY_DN7027_c0_g1~~TRINITY_DN7027_c0_g1_i1.p2  ORF type:complete len:248 (-),score=44.05 TRINITY_DN7027_c0_g1_i1:294-1037(-)